MKHFGPHGPVSKIWSFKDMVKSSDNVQSPNSPSDYGPSQACCNAPVNGNSLWMTSRLNHFDKVACVGADLFDCSLRQRVHSQFPLNPEVRWINLGIVIPVLQTMIYAYKLNMVLSAGFAVHLTISIVLTIPVVVALSSMCLLCQSDMNDNHGCLSVGTSQ